MTELGALYGASTNGLVARMLMSPSEEKATEVRKSPHESPDVHNSSNPESLIESSADEIRSHPDMTGAWAS